MEKRRLEITTKPTYQFSADGHKVFMREIQQEPHKSRRPITDFVIMLMYYGLSVTGWVIAAVLALGR